MSPSAPRRIGLDGLAFAIVLALVPAAAAEETELECLIEPEQRVLLSAAVEGVVSEVLVDRGDRVEKGQVVARLESSLEEATLASAEARARAVGELEASMARLELENTRWRQAQQLYANQLISDLERDEAASDQLVAEADVRRSKENQEQARLELDRARAMVERRRIRSPIDGVVVRRMVSPGEYADPPQILELAQVDPLRVEVYAPVSLLGRFSIGMPGRVKLEEPIGAELEAKVVVVDPVVDAASGTFGVRLELPNPDRSIPAGVNCRVRF